MSVKVLVVDDKQMMRDSVAATLQRAGYTPIAASDGPSAIKLAQKHRPSAVVTDLQMPGMTGIELLTKLRQLDDQLPVVLMTAYGTISEAVEAMKQGAFDFIQKPFEGDQLVMTVTRAVDHRELLKENAQLKASARFVETPSLIGQSQAMRQVLQQIRQIAHSSGTVLIAGESGTGKEVVARTLHAFSQRQERAMLCLNCAALSASLLESELFGHEKGAFTGADQLRKGRFELADNGTLFLDEVSEIGPELQAKLLRVLQEGQFERVGSSMTMQVDVRVIATTNRDLTRSVMAGEFRQDLYYRLNVLPIQLPALRERVEDIPLLAEHFLNAVARREGVEAKKLSEEAQAVLQRYPWPGNVRELQNICERAHVLAKGQLVHGSLLQPWLLAPAPGSVLGQTMAVPSGMPVGHMAPNNQAHGNTIGGPRPQLPAPGIAPGSGMPGTAGGQAHPYGSFGMPMAGVPGGMTPGFPGGHPGAYPGGAVASASPSGGGGGGVALMEAPAAIASQVDAVASELPCPVAEALAESARLANEANEAEAKQKQTEDAQQQDKPADVILPLEEVERQQILQALAHFGGNRSRTAEALGIGLRTLGLKLKKWKEQKLIDANV